jgi:hypothetical protein
MDKKFAHPELLALRAKQGWQDQSGDQHPDDFTLIGRFVKTTGGILIIR